MRNVKARLAGPANDLRLVRFLLVGASGLVINSAALVLFAGFAGLHYLISAALATQCSTLWNFGLTELWVFGDRGHRDARLGRMLRFLLMNNLSLALRGPLLAALVEGLGVHYVASNLLSLLAMALIRYALSDRWIWLAPPEAGKGEVFHYDIHGLVAIGSGIRLPELDYFRVPGLERTPDIRLRQERRRRPRPDGRSIRFQDGLGRHGFEISILIDECTEVQVSPLVRRSPHVLYTNVFEPILRWAFVRKGYALVHGGCIATDQGAVLVTAPTDTGKTTTILRAIRDHRFGFLSDDMTIVGRDGEVLSFPKPLTISAHTLQAIDDSALSWRERAALLIQSRIHSRTGRRFALWISRLGLPAATINALAQILVPPPKYSVDRLLPGAQLRDRARLSQVVLIERGPESMETLSHQTIVEHLIRNAEDAYGFPPYPQLAVSLSQWRGTNLHPREREIISQGISGRPALRLRCPSYRWWVRLPEIHRAEADSQAPGISVQYSMRVSEAGLNR